MAGTDRIDHQGHCTGTVVAITRDGSASITLSYGSEGMLLRWNEGGVYDESRSKYLKWAELIELVRG